MYATSLRINQFWKSLDVGAKQLLQTAISQDVVDDRSFRAQRLQHLFACDILSCLSLLWLFHNLHFTKEYVADLLWRSDIEFFASQLIYMTLQLLHALVESLSCFSQGISIEANAIHLHFGKNRNQWHFDIPEQVFAIYLFEFWLKNIF